MNNEELPETLPILPLRNTVLFPGVVIPITVGRNKSLKLVQEVYKKNKILGAVAQKDGSIEDPELEDLYNTGTVAQILKILEMPDGSTSVIIQGRKRFMLNDLLTDKPYHVARITPLEDEDDEPAGEQRRVARADPAVLRAAGCIPGQLRFGSGVHDPGHGSHAEPRLRRPAVGSVQRSLRRVLPDAVPRL